MSYRNVLITDFDGTLTRHDFYELVVPRCLPPDVPDYWSLYASGRITHFEAMAGIFSHIRCPESKVIEIMREMRPDPALRRSVEALRSQGWQVVIVSNGCRWYIDHFLAEAEIEVEVHSSPGAFQDGQGLQMRAPSDSPYFLPSYGIDKSAVVKDAQSRYDRVAFAGNGPPDLAAALLVAPHLRFARTWLAEKLTTLHQPFQQFDHWSEIASTLTDAAVSLPR